MKLNKTLQLIYNLMLLKYLYNDMLYSGKIKDGLVKVTVSYDDSYKNYSINYPQQKINFSKMKLGIKMGAGSRFLQVLKQNVLQYCKNKVYYYKNVK